MYVYATLLGNIFLNGLHRRGHGTYVDDDEVVAAVTGVLTRVNKLVTVRTLKSRLVFIVPLGSRFAYLIILHHHQGTTPKSETLSLDESPRCAQLRAFVNAYISLF